MQWSVRSLAHSTHAKHSLHRMHTYNLCLRETLMSTCCSGSEMFLKLARVSNLKTNRNEAQHSLAKLPLQEIAARTGSLPQCYFEWKKTIETKQKYEDDGELWNKRFVLRIGCALHCSKTKTSSLTIWWT